MTDAINILLVEDSPQDAELIGHALVQAGLNCSLKTVDDLQGFTSEVEQNPDLILCDFSLPGLSALTILAEVRRRGIEIPVIVVTGTLTDDVASACLEYGAVDYIVKDRLGRLDAAVTRALAERTLRRERISALTALRESEERFRQIAENIGEVVWLTDVETGRVIYISPAYEKTFRRSSESLYTNPDAWLDAVHPEDRIKISAGARQSGALEYRLVDPDGAIRWIHDRSFPIEDPAGRIYRTIRIAEDITRRRVLEEQLRHAQKMEAIGQFAGTVAHDFSNVLTVIAGHGLLVLDEMAPDDPMRHHLVYMRDAAFRASSLTRQLLAFGRRQVLSPRLLDINTVVADVRGMIHRLVGKDIQLNIDLAPALDTVTADPIQIEQILLNLLGNSRDAMPEGGEIWIRTGNVAMDNEQCQIHREVSPGRYVRLAVSDTGMGIAEDHLNHIFEPFFTTKPVGKGTGLGLAAVYGIVKQSGGFVSVASAPGQGTTVTIYLPAIVEVLNDPQSSRKPG